MTETLLLVWKTSKEEIIIQHVREPQLLLAYFQTLYFYLHIHLDNRLYILLLDDTDTMS